MAENTVYIPQSSKQDLIAKIKASDYIFDKTTFKQFQIFFSKEFASVNISKVRKQAWRTK